MGQKTMVIISLPTNVFEQHLLGHQVAQCVTLAVTAVAVKGELRVTLELYM